MDAIIEKHFHGRFPTIKLLLLQPGVIIKGHFELSSGLHSPYYIRKERLLASPRSLQMITNLMVSRVIEVVGASYLGCFVGPCFGGFQLAQAVAGRYLEMKGVSIPTIPFEKVDGDYLVRESLVELLAGKDIFVFEDILTTGQTVAKVIKYAQRLECRVIGVLAMVERQEIPSQTLLELGLERADCLSRLNLPVYTAGEGCPECCGNMPLIPYKSGSKYMRLETGVAR